MDSIAIITKYYKKDSDLYNLLVNHGRDVVRKSVEIAKNHPELNANIQFLEEAGMLHDIGIFLTNAPSIGCHGIFDYICHGYLGRELLEMEGLPEHGLVCERHTGTGLSLTEIVGKNLPLPCRNMMPESIEEQIICFADCFFSKTHIGEEKSMEKVREKLIRFGQSGVDKFEEWCQRFL